jgi:hypothetical protein
MSTSGRLKTWLDRRFLLDNGATIWPPLDEAPAPPVRTGAEAARELGGRKLLRYLLPHQVSQARYGSNDETYATPTPYAPDDTLTWLVLPNAVGIRRHVLILEPTRIPAIIGPIMVAGAAGIQYILVNGYPPEAIIVPGAPGQAWAIVVD